ncbi:uncharacterized protein DUF1924 [Ciceribacter lividus]|uniref:Uncharacterized protein DUF1924 n=1 Tax=Ciceribacter lividus TaxID=1197950 RepID=A0A6I7HSL9_9HYPH|nr:DUF1924 domain-containing protein [Ciceribacter lividus]RCW27949.1 uncharacterized protein DUF1924 [Ciceribacter lividus]
MKKTAMLLLCGLGLLAAAPANADPARDAILKDYASAAGVASFSADAGKALFQANHTGGKPDTPSCTTCHTTDPRQPGKSRVGKVIEPMAVSANPSRFTDAAEVEKWFRRNCTSVLGRECTAEEKGNIITYLSSL